MLRRSDDLPKAHLVLKGTSGNLLHGRVSDATSRIVDDALESLLVIRVGNETEIGYDVLDFLALVEAQAPINTIRNALFAKFFLKATALGVGTVKNGKVAIFATVLTLDAFDVLADYQSLFLVAIGRLVQQFLALVILAEHILWYLVAVMLDEAVGCVDDGLRTTIVLFEFEELGIIKMLGKIEDVVDVRTTKTIDTLRIIADGTYTLFLLAELQDDIHLHMIGVLVLIDQNEIKAVSIFLSDIIMLTEELESQREQIIKVHGIGLLATLHIVSVNLTNLRHFGMQVLLINLHIRHIFGRRSQVVFRHGNPAMHSRRLVGFVIQAQFLDDGFEQGARIGLVINSKVVVKAYMLRFCPKNAREDAVESAHI